MAKLDADIDALFQLPLTEFIGARKALAARLKKDGQADEAERVKLLAKPPISAWTVNQLYWRHRNAFERLMATGQRFRKAQASGKVADMRDALDTRREALLELSDLATEVLSDGGSNPSTDTLRRIATTLEAISSYASLSDGPTPGRLTQDVDPPGFDSFGSFSASAVTTQRSQKSTQAGPTKKATSVSTKTQQQSKSAVEQRRLEERRVKIGAAKTSLQNAKKSLTAARARAQSLEPEKKKADAAAREAEKNRREAEERLKKATTASETAARRAQTVTVEAEEARQALEEATRVVEKTTKELEALFRESAK
ncbi:MAG TPA: hypothetical protein VJT71_05145 [Pyrinomonadaceae bacterium]|nr:hypothetical protein [Pyrinomonadaceae bacterium]